MRVLHVADFHFRLPWFQWLEMEAPLYGAVCFAGDFLDLFLSAGVSLQQQADWVSGWLSEYRGPPLFVCSGNHDSRPPDDPPGNSADPKAGTGWLRIAAREGRVYVDGQSAEVGGVEFACKPWVGLSPRWSGRRPVVLLAHAPPGGWQTGIGANGGDAGDFDVDEIARTLPPSSLILSGHVHEPDAWHAAAAGVTSLNPGVDFSAATPNHIVLDTTARRALFFGRGGASRPIPI